MFDRLSNDQYEGLYQNWAADQKVAPKAETQNRFERWLRRMFLHKEIGWPEIDEKFTRFALLKTRWFSIYLHKLNAQIWHPECHVLAQRDHALWHVVVADHHRAKEPAVGIQAVRTSMEFAATAGVLRQDSCGV